MRTSSLILSGAVLLMGLSGFGQADDFDTYVKSVLAESCVHCHGSADLNGDVNLEQLTTAQRLLEQPDLIKEMIDVISAGDMPPEEEPAIDAEARTLLISTLKSLLREAAANHTEKTLPIRRLNRYQYNNAVKDLFQLQLDVFELPEKLMTRHSDYLRTQTQQMPAKVQVASHSLRPQAGLREVKAFPKDLRAAHGFDNQANQLTLSPLLLDAFLRLSVSIVESPDFNDQNVGIWNDFFQPPQQDEEIGRVISDRLEPFLLQAFRRPLDDETLERYTGYALAKINGGLSFTESMKKVASAALSSPMFLYRSYAADGSEAPFELAANLSFFLWSSGPDLELLRLAQADQLSDPETLKHTIDRMLADAKIERFLDTFPSQWMQLENVLAATPDPQQQRLFSLDKDNPASLQMLLEPLLLFDAVYLENRPIMELIAPRFGYQSEFLKTWYTSDLQPPKIDVESVLAQNREHDRRRQELREVIQNTEAELREVLEPIRQRLLAARQENDNDTEPAVDLKPLAAWEFNGDLQDSLNTLHLNPHGDIEFQDGMVVLDGDYLLSEKLPRELKAKTLEVMFKAHNLDQSGGGVMGIQGPGDFFDTIVLGERQPRHWISGSNGFSRTEDFPESTPEESADQMLHLTMVYQEDGTTNLYRNGQSYGKPYRKDSATFPKDQTSVIFGLRHLPAGGNKFLSVSIDQARLYDRALSPAEVAQASRGNIYYVTDSELHEALTPEQQATKDRLNQRLADAKAALEQVPQPQDPARLQQESRQRFDEQILAKMRLQEFERVSVDDPRYGGVITNAAVLSMTSGPTRTHPIARGAWIIEVIFNDPPPPPPNDVPPLNEDAGGDDLTIREKFAKHRENPDCAGCHSRLDPLGFALENFDITGRWRDRYDNGRDVDPSGTLMRKYAFDSIVEFKRSLVQEERRFAQAFTAHLLRFALSRELSPYDSLTVDAIVDATEPENYRLQSLIRRIVQSERFLTSH